MKAEKSESDLQTIPGVGKATERDFISLGIHSVGELKGENPEELYERLCTLTGAKQDRCVLYVFRAAVRFAETPAGKRTPGGFNWWDFKD